MQLQRRLQWPRLQSACLKLLCLWVLLFSSLPGKVEGQVVVSAQPKFFSSTTHSEVVFLCNQIPSAVVAHLVGSHEVELLIVGATIEGGSSGRVSRSSLKTPEGAPRIRSVRVFATAAGDVVADVRMDSPASRVETLAIGKPPRVLLRLYSPSKTPLAEEKKTAAARKPQLPQVTATVKPVKDATAAILPPAPVEAESEPRGQVILASSSGKNQAHSKAVGRDKGPSESNLAAVQDSAMRSSKAEPGTLHQPKHPTQPAAERDRQRIKAEDLEIPRALAASPKSTAGEGSEEAGNEVGAEVGTRDTYKSNDIDEFPYRLSRVAGVAFFWPEPESPFYQADDEAKKALALLEGQKAASKPDIPAGALPPLGSTPAVLYLRADLSLLRSASSKHLLAAIADYRRALRNAPGWMDAERAMVNILNAYVAIGFDVEAMGSARELIARYPGDPLTSYSRALAARIAIESGRLETARLALKEFGNDPSKGERCFKSMTEGEIAAAEGAGDKAEALLARIDAHCPTAVKKDPATVLLMGRLHLLAGEPEPSLRLLGEISGKLASRRLQTTLAWARVAAYEKLKDTEKATAELETIAGGAYGRMEADRAQIARSYYYAEEGKAEEALNLLAAVYVRSGGALAEQAAKQAAKILGRPGESEQVGKKLLELASNGRRVSEPEGEGELLAPSSTEMLTSAFGAGDYQGVITAYARQPSASDKVMLGSEERWMVGRSYLELGLAEEASRLFRDLVPGLAGELRLLVQADLLKAVVNEKRYDEAERIADHLLRQPLDTTDRAWTNLYKARAAAAQGRRGTAIRVLRKALGKAPREVAPEIRLELAALLRASDSREARLMASRAATRGEANLPQKELVVRARIVEAEAALDAGDLATAVRAFESAADSIDDDQLRAYVRYRLARLLERTGETKRALEVYGEVSRTPILLLKRLAVTSKSYWKLRARARYFAGS